MWTNPEELAEDYLANSDLSELTSIITNERGVDLQDLKDWLFCEDPEETIPDGFLEDLNSCIINHAEWLIDESKRDATESLRNSLYNALDDYCQCLEDSEVASILIDIASTLLKPQY